ncbi:putative malate dehydrogenase 1B [Kryptolebias marmoratus]|uniref:putative malate dehydrogenase 1B n=1 Tax=Kryptolebias marmoratus TaxID=37003 RepID=UPI0007F93D37|nr:putative malate dehydrogenase 1B [Kryptolebias marmoratus]
MAKFVLAGKADCPKYAKAELLADELQHSLPNFRVHKISILPDKWKEWLESTCKTNGWKHEDSPVVWRELVDQGGKGSLLGGLSDFVKHCQDYYGITSDVPTDLMLRVAAENLETKMSLITDEQHRLSLVQPFHIWITGALSLTCQMLIPHLLSVEVFPGITAINLHLLDLEGTKEEMQELQMDVEDLALSTLHQVTVHTGLEQAFQDANVILLLDDFSAQTEDGSDGEKQRRAKATSDRYREYGQLVDERASRQVKVIVSGELSVNLRCLLLAENACSIHGGQFVATATQLEDEARAVIAKEMRVRPSDVTDVFVWGNISGAFFTDLQRAKVFNYRGAVTGPPSFSQPVLELLHDRKWLETDFQQQVHCHRIAVASKSSRPAAVSATNGILRVLKAWCGASGPDEILSVGVLCSGLYGLPDGVVLSVPVRFTDGKWSVLFDVAVDDKLKEKLELYANELLQVCYSTEKNKTQMPQSTLSGMNCN